MPRTLKKELQGIHISRNFAQVLSGLLSSLKERKLFQVKVKCTFHEPDSTSPRLKITKLVTEIEHQINQLPRTSNTGHNILYSLLTIIIIINIYNTFST